MKRTLTGLVAALFLLTLAVPASAISPGTASTPISDGGVTPYIIDGENPGGNRTCAEVGLAYFEDAEYYDGSTARINYSGGVFDAAFPGGLTVNTDGTYVSFESTFAIGAVIVKGSDDANTYVYEPQTLSDSGLAAPPAASGEPAGLSNLTFCWNEDARVQPEGTVSVEKTARTTYTRTHQWDIDKSVSTDNDYEHEGLPKIWLYTDGSGDETATWDVDVTYEGHTDSDWKVQGQIEITVSGDARVLLNSVTDDIETAQAETNATVQCRDENSPPAVTFPYYMDPGDTLECRYEAALGSGTNGTNTATATGLFLFSELGEEFIPTPDEPFSETGTAAVTFGSRPSAEVNKTVNVKDISDLFGEKDLGSVTAPNGDSFTYDEAFSYADYGQAKCGHHEYDNTATIVETGQSADATLAVNVQCLIKSGESATGRGLPWRATKNAPANWFMYTPYAAGPIDLVAGQHHVAGDITMTRNGKTSITIGLRDGWYFGSGGNTVKIHPMTCTTNQKYVPPGQFSVKRTPNADPYTVTNLANTECYAIHVDVYQVIPDPDFGP